MTDLKSTEVQKPDAQAPEQSTVPRKPRKQSPVFFNIIINIAVPALILMKLSTPDRLGPGLAFGLALSFPFTFGLYKLIKERQWDLFAVFGLVNVLLTGGLRLLELDGGWFAVKEGAVPFVLG